MLILKLKIMPALTSTKEKCRQSPYTSQAYHSLKLSTVKSAPMVHLHESL